MSCCNGIAKNPYRADEPVLISAFVAEDVFELSAQSNCCIIRFILTGPRGKKRRDDRGTASAQGPPRPPHLQKIDWRKGFRAASLSQTLRANGGCWKPLLDETAAHRRALDNRIRKARRPPGRCALACQ